jgi:hypothetical protein
VLEEYSTRGPRGTLATEGQVARADALLLLGRRGEALSVMDGLDASGGALEARLRLSRAELRLEAQRCQDAHSDFTTIVTLGDEAIAGRALYGRATARACLEDREGARRDLTEYLERFPSGPLAARAREALSR